MEFHLGPRILASAVQAFVTLCPGLPTRQSVQRGSDPCCWRSLQSLTSAQQKSASKTARVLIAAVIVRRPIDAADARAAGEHLRSIIDSAVDAIIVIEHNG
jgi:hypothetical protein